MLIDIRYAAGFFDGEGCIGVSHIMRKSTGFPHYIVSAKVTNMHRSILEDFQLRWGGSIFAVPIRGNRRPAWYWRVCSQKAKKFIVDVSPYIRIKKPIANAGLALINEQTCRGKHLELAERRILRERRSDLWKVMRRLNQRGNEAWVESDPADGVPLQEFQCWGRAKLTREQVAQIRHKLNLGESQASLGRSYGVTKCTIWRISRGEIWKDVLPKETYVPEATGIPVPMPAQA